MAIAQVQGSPTEAARRVSLWTLSVGSLGVVYGDIGTSPLYALKESLSAASDRGPVAPVAVYGVVSLILWTLIVIVTIKYVLFLLRADNHGEGGTLTLMALAQRAVRSATVITMLGMLSAALFYGDAVITPAISVLSAIEGLKVVTPAFDSVHRAAQPHRADRTIRRAKPRHGEGCRPLWADHVDLVRRYRVWRVVPDHAKP